MLISVTKHLLCVLLGQKDPFSHSKVHLFILKLNFTGKEGVLSLTAAVGGKSALRTLYVQGQSVTLTEPQMVEESSKLATCLGKNIFIVHVNQAIRKLVLCDMQIAKAQNTLCI